MEDHYLGLKTSWSPGDIHNLKLLLSANAGGTGLHLNGAFGRRLVITHRLLTSGSIGDNTFQGHGFRKLPLIHLRTQNSQNLHSSRISRFVYSPERNSLNLNWDCALVIVEMLLATGRIS
ncbi:Hypothetical predicted protein [Cloeon dipterum]|uniref:Uncharacterized protein n=1 Tax=Cloeon dipterum TaxID=197152 RepID=A0A8S1CTE4_9INSE|nr:Hypothetical predicted protein [Cloeon dipterum]